jgi:beta-glucosidase
MDWEIYPQGLTETLAWTNERYGDLAIYITENGAAFDDHVNSNGAVDDPLRVQYLRDHLAAARQAIEAGVNLRGYFVWSLLDNFEWGHGYTRRFGIVSVDFESQRRVPKSSARFYADVIRTNGQILG